MVLVRSLLKKALSGNGEVTEMELIKLTQEECLFEFRTVSFKHQS